MTGTRPMRRTRKGTVAETLDIIIIFFTTWERAMLEDGRVLNQPHLKEILSKGVLNTPILNNGVLNASVLSSSVCNAPILSSSVLNAPIFSSSILSSWVISFLIFLRGE